MDGRAIPGQRRRGQPGAIGAARKRQVEACQRAVRKPAEDVLAQVEVAVGVALETMKQVDSQLMMRNYEGFLSAKK